MAKQQLNMTVIVVTVLILLVVGGLGGWYLMNKSGNERTISASGNAQITVMPDKAIIYLMIQTKNASADVAKNMNSEISQKVLDALDALGIAKDDIETQNYNIYQEYDWSSGTQKPLDFVASNTIKVSSNDFNNVGKIVDSAVSAGALVNSIDFELSNEKQNEYKAQVLANASQDARTKAQAVASGLGKKLGNIVSVSSSDYNYMPYPLYARAESAGAADLKSVTTNISPQKLEVYGSVTVTYSIK